MRAFAADPSDAPGRPDLARSRVTGRICPECRNPTLAKVDGCDQCGHCGWIGTCG
jgi:ribonucleoside-diphosphate reductase alpha chain